ncbi:hypothetical protein ACFQ9U_06665 [Streptomyces sp. NPDC056568]|uniref:hypothetical protein n=1 Tax=Streptomyces sp. NPDC056568 TaxID=3345866 RepID=UPI00367BE564
MSRLLRYLIIWLSCTAASVTAVIITIHFVVGSTRPTAPVAQSAPQELAAPSTSPRPSPSRTAKPSPSPSATSREPSPTPTRTTEKPADPTPTPTPTARTTPPRAPAGGGDLGCEDGGAGVYTVPSEGGKVTVRFGGAGVCLISAVPNQGFTVGTSQSDPRTLTVTFSADRHRSEITATTQPRSQASVREVSF